MKTRIQKWGNSLALRIPQAFAKNFNVTKGSAVDMYFRRQVELSNMYRTMEANNYGTAEQIERFVKPTLAGRFTGTMCLSEPQAGSSLADITTRRVADKTDYVPMYINALTARYCDHVKMPLTMDTDEDAMKAAVKSLWGLSGAERVKMAIIRNTLELDDMLISAALLPEVAGTPGVQVTEGPLVLRFDDEGRLE